MSTRRALQLFLLVFALSPPPAVGGGNCPHLCECKWKSGKEAVICLHANLSHVPLHLDAGTHVLDMTANNIVSLRHDEFSNAGLLNLQKIYVSKCRLKNLDRYTFRHLTNLVDLDLSFNALAAVPSHTFDSITELRELKLNGNPIQRIVSDAFLYLPHLIRLELSECKISTIENKAFNGLEWTLEYLKLDKNRLYSITSNSLTVLNNLKGIELADNPWNCTCDLRPLREWIYKKNVPFGIPPHCQYPRRLQDKSWDKIELDEFACSPEIFAFESKAFGVEGRNITMTCQFKGMPEPNVRWIFKYKLIANLSGTPYTNGKKLYLVHLQNSSSNLTILTADIQDAGVYICIAENKAGKAEASVSLAVSKKPPKSTLSTRVFMASIIAGILFVLASCLITLYIFIYKKKHAMMFNTWRRSERCHQEDTYEKIELNHKPISNGGRNSTMIESHHPGVILRGQKKHHGDYSVVPAVDTDQDEDYDEDDRGKSDRETKMWKPGPIEERSVIGAELMESRREDLNDLHIPRRVISDSVREDSRRPCNSPVTPYATISKPSPYQALPNTAISSQGRILPQVPPRNKKHGTNVNPDSLSTTNKLLSTTGYHSSLLPSSELPSGSNLVQYAAAGPGELHNLEEEDSMAGAASSGSGGRFPDLIENSPKKYASAGSNNNFHCASSRPASEGGGSVNDINELFCTLPRKQRVPNTSRYRSFDSQSPLLPESRYGSSGGDSNTSNCSSSRRLVESQQRTNAASKQQISSLTNQTNSNPGKSSSYLNLTSNHQHQHMQNHNKNSPIREMELLNNATPLLDIVSLENRMTYKQEPLAITPTLLTTNLNTYDYHAAQLERFLEEYRTLQKELTKMKQTCDNMRQDKMQNSLSVTPSTVKSPNALQITSPNSNQPLAVTSSGQYVVDGELAMFLSNQDVKNNRLFNNQ